MKTKRVQHWLLMGASVTALAFSAGNVAAQGASAAPAPAAAGQTGVQLSYGVPEVLQLVQARVNDSIIVNYIQNSGTIYSLDANQIVYLKQQGASDAVLNAMLNQRVRLTGSTEPGTTTSSPAVASASAPAPSVAAPAVSSSVAYDQSAQPAAAPSSVYVIPDTQTYYYDNWYYGGYPYYYSGYPYYYGYGYGWPAIGVSFGWGGYGGWHGGYYGGWHGGGYGGGFHSGGYGGGFHGGGGFHR